MGFVSCLEDQQQRLESDLHLLQTEVRAGNRNAEDAKKDALRILHDAKVYWHLTLNYLDELTSPEFEHLDNLEVIQERCEVLESRVSSAEHRLLQLSQISGLLSLQSVLLREQLQQERALRRQLERDFEKIGREDFGRMVEPFLSKTMFEKHMRP